MNMKLSYIQESNFIIVSYNFRLWQILSTKNIIVPLINQFVIMFGLGALEAMIGPYLKKIGASDHDIGVSFMIMGCMLLLGNFLVARVGETANLQNTL